MIHLPSPRNCHRILVFCSNKCTRLKAFQVRNKYGLEALKVAMLLSAVTIFLSALGQCAPGVKCARIHLTALHLVPPKHQIESTAGT